MPGYTSRKRLKKKVLDRWENEGGMIPDKQTKTLESGSPDERVNEGSDVRSSESPTGEKREIGRAAQRRKS